MIMTVMKGVAQGQEVREKQRDKTVGMDGRGIEASQHAVETLKGGPVMHQQL